VFSETLERLVYEMQLLRQHREVCQRGQGTWGAMRDLSAEHQQQRRACEDAELAERDAVEEGLLLEYLAVGQRLMSERRRKVWTDVEGREYRSRQFHEKVEAEEFHAILVLVDRAFGSFGWLRRATELMRLEGIDRAAVEQEEFTAFRSLRIAALRQWHAVFSTATRDMETVASFVAYETTTRKDLMTEGNDAWDAITMRFRAVRQVAAEQDRARAQAEALEAVARHAVLGAEVAGFGALRTQFFVDRCAIDNAMHRDALEFAEGSARDGLTRVAWDATAAAHHDWRVDALLIDFCRALSDVEQEEELTFRHIAALARTGHQVTKDVEYVLGFYARQEEANRAALASHEHISRGNTAKRFVAERDAIARSPRPTVATAPTTLRSLAGVECAEAVGRGLLAQDALTWGHGDPTMLSNVAQHLANVYAATVGNELRLWWRGLCTVELEKVEWLEARLRRRVAVEARRVLQLARAAALEGKEPLVRRGVAVREAQMWELLCLVEADERPSVARPHPSCNGAGWGDSLVAVVIAGQTVMRPMARPATQDTMFE
jgi:hypothetical protein